MPNRLTPHLLTELAGLSEGLLESYGDSWDFADEMGVYLNHDALQSEQNLNLH